MKLDEAIKRAEERAKDCNTETGMENWQLAEWLKELREMRRGKRNDQMGEEGE